MAPELIVHCGDFLVESAKIADGSVHCCVTSPPYFSCRDYHIEPTQWPAVTFKPMIGVPEMTVPAMTCCLGLECGSSEKVSGVVAATPYHSSLDAFVAHMVHVFRIVKRVLREDGTCWVNLGDTFSGGGFGGGGVLGKNWAKVGRAEVLNGKNSMNPNKGRAGDTSLPDEEISVAAQQHRPTRRPRVYEDNPLKNIEAPWRSGGKRRQSGFKDKDLMGVPWRCAFALQADGWYLRMDNVWAKENPMPESAQDRPTKSHEYVFLLAKSEKYFYDREAVREQQTGGAHARARRQETEDRGQNGELFGECGPSSLRSYDAANPQRVRGVTPKSRPDRSEGVKANHSFHKSLAQYAEVPGGRNMRSVWRLKVMPFSGPHTATYPVELARRCILAGSSPGGCCAECGRPLTRILEKGPRDAAWQKSAGGDTNGDYNGTSRKGYQAHGAQDASSVKARILAGMVQKKTIGWRRGCKCEAKETRACVVLDPFLGSGTTAQAAMELGRSCVGVEKNPRDLEWIRKRTATTVGMGI